ncbi:MAG TPA: hypothetical protein VMR70_21155, partial [Flavisolibacter sp.]|nr:hypothetical protein [Flavisolibacter sp.]
PVFSYVRGDLFKSGFLHVIFLRLMRKKAGQQRVSHQQSFPQQPISKNTHLLNFSTFAAFFTGAACNCGFWQLVSPWFFIGYWILKRGRISMQPFFMPVQIPNSCFFISDF